MAVALDPLLVADVPNFDIKRSSYQSIICYKMQDLAGNTTVIPVVVADLDPRPLFPIPVQIHSLGNVVEQIQRFGNELGSTVKQLELRVKTLVDENLWGIRSQRFLLRNLKHLEKLDIDYFFAPREGFFPIQRNDNQFEFCRFNYLKVTYAHGYPEQVFSILYRFPSVTHFNLVLKLDNTTMPEHVYRLLDALNQRKKLRLEQLQCLALNFLYPENDNKNRDIASLSVFIQFYLAILPSVKHESVDCCLIPSHLDRAPNWAFHLDGTNYTTALQRRMHDISLNHDLVHIDYESFYRFSSSIVSLKSFRPHIVDLDLRNLEDIFAGEEAKGVWFPVDYQPSHPPWPTLKEIRFDTEYLLLNQVTCVP
jgi:hypothetical protein